MSQELDGCNGHVYIVSAARTPIVKLGGALSAVPAVDLGGVAIRAAVRYGLATLCLGGGGSVAAAFVRVA